VSRLTTATASAVPTRVGFSFAADGRHAACLMSEGGSPPALEWWSFGGVAAGRRLLSSVDSMWSQVLCVAGGRVLLNHPGAGGHQVVLTEPTETGLAKRPLFTAECPGFRLLDTPGPGALAVAIGRVDEDRSQIWRILPEPPWREFVTELPGTLSGGHWLDEEGHLLAVNQMIDDEVTPVAVHLRLGTAEPIGELTQGQHVLLTGPRSGLLVVAGSARGVLKLGHTRAGGGRPPHFAERLDAVEGSAVPIAVSPDGERVALRVDRRTRSHLYVYEPGKEEIHEISMPAGIIGAVGRWTDRGLRFPFSTPTRPTSIATVDPNEGRYIADAPTENTPWIDGRVHEFPGPAGPVEAVVYGDGDWRDAAHVLISLHGGPEAAIRLGFDPRMQALAGAGITVISPNYRGSTGYGEAHRQAIEHALGGPDLADVRAVARHVTRARRRAGTLMSFGESYGAFLALLAAGADPGLWSHCVAVAPFLSGQRLYADGSQSVRALLDRLGGRTTIDDDLGPRDLAFLCERITARLLVIHGANDAVIPVGQSRDLRARLLRAGREEGTDFIYLESATGGHNPLEGSGGTIQSDDILEFLLGARPRRRTCSRRRDPHWRDSQRRDSHWRERR
jgi:pimeloyl-ACP methyl ester carboxylesterase